MIHIDPSDLIGPGPAKLGLKVMDKMGVGDFKTAISELDQLTTSPAYIKCRMENAEDKLNEFWDNHQDDFDEAIDTASEGLEDVVDTVVSFFSSIF